MDISADGVICAWITVHCCDLLWLSVVLRGRKHSNYYLLVSNRSARIFSLTRKVAIATKTKNMNGVVMQGR